MLITPDQIRAARALKSWSQTDLAERTGLAVPTIANIEAGKQEPGSKTLEKIQTAFDIAGIEFIAQDGVRRKAGQVEVLRGKEGFEKFYYAVYQEGMSRQDCVFLLNNIDEHLFDGWIPSVYHDTHLPEMIAKRNTCLHILVKEGDTYFPFIDKKGKGGNVEYRWIPPEMFDNVSFYVFNDRLGIFLFIENSEPIIFLMNHKEAADTYRNQFLPLWNKAKVPDKKKKAGK